MRKHLFALAALVAGPLAAWACGSDSGSPVGSSDAGPDVTNDVPVDTHVIPPVDGYTPTIKCLLDNQQDPVSFCIQKSVLTAQSQVFSPTSGVAPSWSSTTGQPDPTPSDIHQDIVFGEALAHYLQSAQIYGDTEKTAAFTAELLQVAQRIEAEAPLASWPEYGGDDYVGLRAIAVGLFDTTQADDARKINTLADIYGRSVFNNFALQVPSTPDAGADAGASGGGTLLGTPAAGGQVAYVTADVASGALVLLDMADRFGCDAGDAGDSSPCDGAPDQASALAWQAAALSSLQHLVDRARDPATGMYFASLVTSADPAHDALAQGTSPFPGDALFTDVQGAVALALTRAFAVATKSTTLGSAAKSFPYEAHALEIFEALNGNAGSAPQTMWDGAGPGESDAAVMGAGGYFEAYSPSTHVLFSNKTTRGNALLYAAMHRYQIDVASEFVWQLPLFRALFTSDTGQSTGLYDVLGGGLQAAYFRATSQAFGPAVTYLADGGLGGPDPTSGSYTTVASMAAMLALNEEWYGCAGRCP
jgi:hypothetical protein